MWCLLTSADDPGVGKLFKIAKGAIKGLKASKGAKGAKGTNGAGDDVPKDADEAFNLGEGLLGGLGAIICWDVWESYWALEECLSNQGC